MNATYRMLLIVAVMLAWFVPTAHARWYDPAAGRWLTRDPMQYVNGSNQYQYVVSNPLRYVDRNGWQAEEPSGSVAQPEANPTSDQIPPCKDEKGNPISLTFDGNTLKGNGFCATMVSGSDPETSTKVTVTTDGVYTETTLTFDYSKQRQRVRDAGPMPEGCYYFRSDHEDSASGTNNPHGQPSNRHKYWPKTRGWGDYSWPLTPYSDTDVTDSDGNPRSGFFLHGGAYPGSAGCGDLCDGDGDLHTFMDKVRANNPGPCYIKMCAKYAADKMSIVKKSFGPWLDPAGNSQSPWMPK